MLFEIVSEHGHVWFVNPNQIVAVTYEGHRHIPLDVVSPWQVPERFHADPTKYYRLEKTWYKRVKNVYLVTDLEIKTEWDGHSVLVVLNGGQTIRVVGYLDYVENIMKQIGAVLVKEKLSDA